MNVKENLWIVFKYRLKCHNFKTQHQPQKSVLIVLLIYFYLLFLKSRDNYMQNLNVLFDPIETWVSMGS